MKKFILALIILLVVASLLFGAYHIERDSQAKAFGGTYLLHDDDLAPTAQVTMTLNDDKTVNLVTENLTIDSSKNTYEGTWDIFLLNDLKITIDKQNGNDVSSDEVITFKTDDTFIKESDYQGELFKDGVVIDDQETVPLGKLEFNLGAGDTNKTVAKLNDQLVADSCLDNDKNSGDTYSENTRKAVVRFQKDNSLESNGIVTLDTWNAIFANNAKCEPLPPPPPPEPEPEPEPADNTAQPATPPSSNNAPSAQFAVGNVATHDGNGNPIVYLTFDDGPSSTFTNQILNILSQSGAQATFFELGNQAQSLPQVVKSVASQGHYIGNHTFDHEDLATLSASEVKNEVNQTEQILTSIVPNLNGTGTVDLLRPPYGSESDEDISIVNNLGYTIVLWDIDPQDWRRPGTQSIVSNIMSHMHPGAIVLSHDGGGDRSQTVAAYRQIVPQLKQQGYVFWTVQQGLQ